MIILKQTRPVLNMHKRRAATEFGRKEISAVAKRFLTNHRLVVDRSVASWRLIAI